jgi:hypothetical protein
LDKPPSQAAEKPLAKIRPGNPAPTMGPGTLGPTRWRCLKKKSVLTEGQHAFNLIGDWWEVGSNLSGDEQTILS